MHCTMVGSDNPIVQERPFSRLEDYAWEDWEPSKEAAMQAWNHYLALNGHTYDQCSAMI